MKQSQTMNMRLSPKIRAGIFTEYASFYRPPLHTPVSTGIPVGEVAHSSEGVHYTPAYSCQQTCCRYLIT